MNVISKVAQIPEDMVFREVTDRFRGIEDAARRRGSSGSEQAIGAVARRLVLNKGPLKDGFDRPDGVLLFLGPTGVGKTELAKSVAEFLFGDEKKMIRVDMSEYQDGAVAVDKLIGMPRGIVGSERGGVLTNQLKDNPYSVVLLDEVEKASPTMLNLFLQAFDEGWITDGRGKRVYLSDAIVIMTSNIGSECFRKLTSPLGFLSKQVGVEQIQGEITARGRAALLARVPQSHRRGRHLPAADEGRSAADHGAADRRRSQRSLAKSGRTFTVTPEAMEQLVQRRLQPGLRRAFPEARDRRHGSSCRSASAGPRATTFTADVREGRIEIEVSRAPGAGWARRDSVEPRRLFLPSEGRLLRGGRFFARCFTRFVGDALLVPMAAAAHRRGAAAASSIMPRTVCT